MRHSFVRKIGDSISRHSLLAGGAPVVVGLSGGADSVALLAALCDLGYRCVAAHCNFGLRGDESDRDCEHARRVADKLGAEWMTVRFDTKAFCRENGLCIEDGCRRLRYEWFGRIAGETGAQAVAVAHHREDQVETFFLNLLRSSGLRGLKGMLPRNGNIVRPMLDVTRGDVIGFLADRHLDFVTDSSNLSDDYTRNRLRHNVLPALREASAAADADAAVVAAMAHVDESRRLLDALVASVAAGYAAGDGWNVAAISGNVPCAAAFLHTLLSPLGFSRDVTDAIHAAATSTGSRLFADRNGNRWILHNGVFRKAEVSLAGSTDFRAASLSDLPLMVEVMDVSEFSPCRDARFLYLDAEATEGVHSWQLRPWRHGDRIKPFGMNGSRLVSDILSDAKVPADRKKNVMVLTRDEEILWVVGYRTSRHFAIAAATRSVLKIGVSR